MSGPLAYRNGQLVQEHELTVPVTDAGFIQGLTVAEQLRTFAGRLFRLDEHLQRLRRSLDIVGVPLPVAWPQLELDAKELVRINYSLLPAGADLGLCLFVTPGPYSAYAAQAAAGPLLGMHTVPLNFASWADKYDQGQALQVVATRQVPTQCWPAALKCRSRMHYYLADLEAAAADPGSRALLLDLEGRVMEASTANVVFYFAAEGIVSPPEASVLPGISMATLRSLAEQSGLPWRERHLTAEEVVAADEILICSTSICVLAVTQLNGRPVGTGQPGPIYRQLLAAWSTLVGLDIRHQAVDAASAKS